MIGGLLGHGDSFVMRDPNGIRPAFYYKDDEVVVVASERPAIQTAFNVNKSNIRTKGRKKNSERKVLDRHIHTAEVELRYGALKLSGRSISDLTKTKEK